MSAGPASQIADQINSQQASPPAGLGGPQLFGGAGVVGASQGQASNTGAAQFVTPGVFRQNAQGQMSVNQGDYRRGFAPEPVSMLPPGFGPRFGDVLSRYAVNQLVPGGLPGRGRPQGPDGMLGESQMPIDRYAPTGLLSGRIA